MDSAGLKELRRWVGFTADKQLDKALGIQQNPEKTLLSRLYFGGHKFIFI
jgi:hypothetical protein